MINKTLIRSFLNFQIYDLFSDKLLFSNKIDHIFQT